VRIPSLFCVVIAGCAGNVTQVATPAPSASKAKAPIVVTGKARWGRGLEAQRVLAMAREADGGAIVIGMHSDTSDFDDGVTVKVPPVFGAQHTSGTFVASFAPDGTARWATSLARGWVSPLAMRVLASGEIVVIATADGAEWSDKSKAEGGQKTTLLRLDKAGKILKKVVNPSAISEPYAIIDEQGGAVLAGWFQGKIALGKTSLEAPPKKVHIALARLDPAGEITWARAFGDERAKVTAIDLAGQQATGDLLLAGVSWGAFAVDQLAFPAGGGTDVWAARLDHDGHTKWAKYGGDKANQSVTGAAFDRDGRALIAGTFAGHLDLGVGAVFDTDEKDKDSSFLVALSKDGTAVASRKLEKVRISGLATADRDLLLKGWAKRDAVFDGPVLTEGISADEEDGNIWLTRLSPELSPRWTRKLNGIIEGILLQPDGDGALFVGGWAKRSFQLGNRQLEHPSGPGSESAFLASFDP
jgi:hypothetical protein